MGILFISSFYKYGCDCCVIFIMPFSTVTKRVSITFPTIAQLNAFKHECGCHDFYVERDALLLVGSFTEEQLQIANYKYGATYEVMKE